MTADRRAAAEGGGEEAAGGGSGQGERARPARRGQQNSAVGLACWVLQEARGGPAKRGWWDGLLLKRANAGPRSARLWAAIGSARNGRGLGLSTAALLPALGWVPAGGSRHCAQPYSLHVK